MRFAVHRYIPLIPFLFWGAAANESPVALAAECGGGPALDASALQPGADGRIEVLQIRAVFNNEGTEPRRKHPLEWKRRTRLQTIPLTDGALCLRISFADGEVAEIPFDAYVEGDAVDGPKFFGGFTLEIPVPDERQVAEVKIARDEMDAIISWSQEEIPARP